MLGHVAVQVVYVQRRCYVSTSVGAQHTGALCQERISHQGADQSSQAYEEMQGLWQDIHVELETVASNNYILPEMCFWSKNRLERKTLDFLWMLQLKLHNNNNNNTKP